MSNGRHGGHRMTKQWSQLEGGPLILTGNGTFLAGNGPLNIPGTVMRLIGGYSMGPTTAPTALDEVEIVVAIGVVSADAAALGATAMPDPADEPDYPWLYWASNFMFFATNSTSAGIAAMSVRRHFDVRSMRKMKARESLAMIVQYVDVVGSPPIHVSLDATRYLIGS